MRKYDESINIWFTSDLHFGHDRQFLFAPRGFTNIRAMNEEVLKNFNMCVQPEDEVYILGDLTLGNLEEGAEYLRQLNGHIHVIRGNHDTDRRVEFYESLGWDVHDALRVRWGKYTFFLCHYPVDTFNNDKYLSNTTLSISGHTHSKEIWNNCNSFNVCLDAHNNYPVNIKDIILSFMDKKNS